MSRRAALPVLATVLLLGGCVEALRWETPARRPPSAWEPAPQRKLGVDEHRVESGDTVYSIAFRNQLDFRELAQWNGIGPDYLIVPGQVLRLTPPVASARAPASAAASARPRRPPAEPVPTTLQSGPKLSWRWPTKGELMRRFLPDKGVKGIDIRAPLGRPVLAAAPGRVVYSGSALKGYGELVIIKHDDVYLSAYGYNRRRLVKEGDVVAAGQPIAELGYGPEQTPLLHFEIRERGKPVNPLSLLPPP